MLLTHLSLPPLYLNPSQKNWKLTCLCQLSQVEVFLYLRTVFFTRLSYHDWAEWCNWMVCPYVTAKKKEFPCVRLKSFNYRMKFLRSIWASILTYILSRQPDTIATKTTGLWKKCKLWYVDSNRSLLLNQTKRCLDAGSVIQVRKSQKAHSVQPNSI